MGIIQRRCGGQHDGIGVYDRITWNVMRSIAGYCRQMTPRVRQLIASPRGTRQMVVLQSPCRPPQPYRRRCVGVGYCARGCCL